MRRRTSSRFFSSWDFAGMENKSLPVGLLDAATIGLVLVTWNSVHSTVHSIFVHLSSLGLEAANAIFFTLKQDRAQRDITRALAKVRLAAHDALATRLNKLFNEIDELGGERNAVAHTLWEGPTNEGFEPYRFAVHHGALDLGDYREQFTALNEKLMRIGRDLTVVYHQIVPLFPLPHKLPPQSP